MIYMDRTMKKQEPKEKYQEDSLKVLIHIDEAKFKDLYAVINSAEFLEDETRKRILERIVIFSQDDETVKNLAVSKLFALTDEKLKLYEENEHMFQNSRILIEAMLNYLINNKASITGSYEIVRDFIKSVSVTIGDQDSVEQIALKGIELTEELMFQSLGERESEIITNPELEVRTKLLSGVVSDFFSKISDPNEKAKYKNEVNVLIEDISVFCGTDILQYQI